MSTRHGAPGGLGRGLSALIRTSPRPEEAERSVAVLDPAAGSDAAGRVILDSSVPPDGDRRTEPPSAPPSPEVERKEPAAAAGVPGARFAEIDIAAIRANPRQPRQIFDEDSLGELTHSIREFGVLQPVVVRRPAGSDGSYELVMGERRLRAAAAAGLTRIPAIVRDTADDAMLRDALLENLHRTGLNPLEEAAAYQQLLDDFGVTHEELALRIGRSRSQVSNTIRLMNLSIPVQRRVAAGVISAGHARALLALADRDAQDELAGRIVAEGLSVRATEEIVATAAREATRDGPARRSATHRITAPGLHELADRLSDVLDTRVRVDLGRRKGKITVEFASVDDLERIVGVIAPELAVHRVAAPEHINGSDNGPFDPAGRIGRRPSPE